MKSNKTDIILLIDKSGSMTFIKDAMESQLAEFIIQQKGLEGEAYINIFQFDNRFEQTTSYRNLKDFTDKIIIRPDGSTALYDAMAKSINLTGERLSNTDENERPSKVLFVVITDGEENSSKEFNCDKIKSMVEHQTQKYNWNFLYIGANQDAVLNAGNIGIINSTNYMATTLGVADMTRNLSAYATSYRTSK